MIFIIADLSACSLTQNEKHDWREWRGPFNTGVAQESNPPVEFGEDLNLKWKTEISGKGHATPIIRGNQIILLSAVATDQKAELKKEEVAEEEGGRRRGMRGTTTEFIHKFNVVSVDKRTGNILWETTVKEEHPQESTHNLGSWASNSPVTDGKYIFAYFGSRGLYCLDLKGKVLWEKDWGQMEKVMSFGEGSSPALFHDKIVVLWDHEGESFIVTLDKKTGDEIWKADRDERTSWSTPMIIEINGNAQVITSATNKIRSYDLETGDIIWEGTGMTRNVIPNPVYSDGILYLMSGYRGTALQAIDLEKANGDISGTEVILWEHNQDTPYTPCPVMMNGYLYFLRANTGSLTCLDAKSGEVQYSTEKVEGISSIFSSPTGAADKLYIAGTENVTVVQAGPEFKILSQNKLEDTFHASPVIIGDELFLRGFKSLYCFAEEK